MMRREDWFERLSDVVARHQNIPFAYGKADCLTFPLECAEAMTGETFNVPAYKTETLDFFVPMVTEVFARKAHDPAVQQKGVVKGLPPMLAAAE